MASKHLSSKVKGNEWIEGVVSLTTMAMTEFMAIPLDPLPSTQLELSLGVHATGALHALSPTVL